MHHFLFSDGLRFVREILALFCLVTATLQARHATGQTPESTSKELENRFSKIVLPFLKDYCYECHGPQKQEGKLDLSGHSTLHAIVQNHQIWQIVVERISADEMPPKEAAKQPTTEQKKAVIGWSRALSDFEAERHAGDPGMVLIRRLNNAEYDNSIRDLTGFDIRPTKEFPVDPANEAGFDNSSESLTMSPALMKKYLAAARHVADHAVLTPNGFIFAPHVCVTETDRDKFCVHRIVDFYRQHEVDFADYFYAAWEYRNREALGRPTATFTDIASAPRITWPQSPSHKLAEADSRLQAIPRTAANKSPLSSKYLTIVWTALISEDSVGPLADVQKSWNQICERFDARRFTSAGNPGTAIPPWKLELRREFEKLRDNVIEVRATLNADIKKLKIAQIADGTQPLVLWFNRQIAVLRMNYLGDGEDRGLYDARRRFCRTFPNAFAVASRSHHSNPKLGADVRYLTAGFHLMHGYFRDDQPLCELVLSDAERQELDSYWKTLDFVTLSPIRQYKDYLFAERAEPPHFAEGREFDFARPENKDIVSQANLDRMRDLYLKKLSEHEPGEAVVDAIRAYFANISADIRWIERAQLGSQASHLDSLVEFATRAWRRPLSENERSDLLAFYDRLKAHDGLNHEEAIRDSIASVLLSPHFSYRMDLASADEKLRPLTDYELASRLSYFLWSSTPDSPLLASAEKGELHQPQHLFAHARRMLHDKRVRGLATEFAGNWLEFRRFEEHNAVDRERFPSFTNELRQAMFEEPIQLFVAIASQNRSIMEFVEGNYTYVNPPLAAHYGIELASTGEAATSTSDNDWVRIDHADKYGRGGLLPMSVFLTKNSPGLRTSPVKRGYWVVRRLLGEHIPPPPPTVPELPKDEAQLGNLSLAQLLAKHRDHQACAGCHQRFDSFGLAFEGYGPIGERRVKDLGGHPIETKATFPDGNEGDGLTGLRSYLVQQRKEELIDNLCRKLLSYALGRSLQLSDKSTVQAMQSKLKDDEYRFESLIQTIILSPQFTNKRGTP